MRPEDQKSSFITLIEQIKQEVLVEIKKEREKVKENIEEDKSGKDKRKRKLPDLQSQEKEKKIKTEKIIKLEKKTGEVKEDLSRAIEIFRRGDEQEKGEGIRLLIRASFFSKEGLKVLEDPVDNKILANITALASRLNEGSFKELVEFFIPYFNQEDQIQFSADPQNLTSFEERIKNLASKNKFLAERIKELIESSYTNIKDYSGLPKSMVLDRLDILISPQSRQTSQETLFSPEERAKYEYYEKQINTFVRDYRKKSDPAEKRDIEQEIAIAVSLGDKEKLKEILGWDDDRIEDYFQLNKKIVGLEDINHFLETADRYGYHFTQSEVEFLSPVFWANSFDRYFSQVDGHYVLNQEGVKTLRKKSIFLLTKLLDRIDPEQDWQRGWNELQEGVVFRGLIGNLYKLLKSPNLREKLDSNSLLNFQREIEKTVNGLYAEFTARELYHEMRRYIVLGVAAPKDMANFMRRFPASRLTYILESFDSEIVEMARLTFESMIQYEIAINNNRIDPGIFKTFFDAPKSTLKTEYYEEIRDLVFEYFRKIGEEDIDLIELNTRVKRAMILGMGFSFAVSTRLPTILSTAEPSEGFAGQPFIVQFFNLRHRWRLGRGGEDIFLYPEMFDLEVAWSPDLTAESFFTRLRKHWKPKKVYKGKVKRTELIERDLLDEISQRIGFIDYDQAETKKGRYKPKSITILIRDFLRKFTLPDFLSRGGWRINPFKEYIKEEYGISLSELEDFNKSYQYVARYVGVGALWLLDAERISKELEKILPKRFFGEDFKLFLKPEEISKIMNSLTLYKGESAQRLLDFFDLDGNKIQMTVSQFIQEKGLHLRGSHFLQLLRRSPLDFLTIMLQFEPWLAEIITTKQGEKLTAFEFYFAEEKDFRRLSRADQSIINERLENLEKRWGKKNLVHIKRIAKFWSDYYRSEPGLEKEMKKRLFSELSLARARVISNNKLEMSVDDINDRVIRDLLFGERGLINYFNSLNERFADKETDFGKLGDRGFFYKMAERWFLIEKIGIVPSLNDSKMGPIFRKIEIIGHDPFARNWGDQASLDEALSKFQIFDKLVKKVSVDHDYHIMFKEFHKILDGVVGVFGTSATQELHAVMMLSWIRYFQTHYIDRLPFPLNFSSIFLGKQVSLSTLKDGYLAYRLRDEDIRQIILEAYYEGYIGDEHKQWLEKALGVGLDMYAPKLATTIIFLMLMVSFIQMFKKAAKEELEKKK